MLRMPPPITSHQHSRSGGEEVIVGVDTHKDTHTAAVLTTLGILLGHRVFPASRAGYGQLLDWARSFGVVARAGVEGTGSYGATLSRHLRAADIEVVEVHQPDKSTRADGARPTIDAELAARAVLSGRADAVAKANDGPVEMLRLYKNARSSAVKARTQAINQLKAIIIRVDPQLREQLTGLTNAKLFRACADLPDTNGTSPWDAAVHTLRTLAQRIQHLTARIQRAGETDQGRGPVPPPGAAGT